MGSAVPTDNAEAATEVSGEGADVAPALVVIDDMTSDVAIGVTELEAIETYLADVLDVVFGEAPGAASSLRRRSELQ